MTFNEERRLMKEYRVCEKVDIIEMQEICRGMRTLLTEWDSGRIPNQDYTISNLKTFCESLVRKQKGVVGKLVPGSWCVAPSADDMPGDARVEFVYLPTYIAVAILSKFQIEYPRLACEIEGHSDSLRKGMEFATLRDLSGHGYDSEYDTIEALEILGEGRVPEFLLKNPEACPALLKLLRDVKMGIDQRIADGDTHGMWGQDHSKGFLSASRILKHL